MSFRRGFKADANRVAIRIRERMGLAAIDPIEPSEICEFMEIELIALSKLECDATPFLGDDRSCFSAVTVPRGMRIAIVHNDSHHRYRQRSNVCHELAHCFLGHEHAPPLTETGERFHDGGVEAEANFLAGALLLPNEAAIHVVRNGLVTVAQDIYGVSRPMLDYRLRISGADAIGRRSQPRAPAQ